MADKKKDKKDVEDINIDDLDDMGLEGLDDFEIDEVEFDRKPTMTEYSKELAEEAGKGFLSDLISTTAKKSLPEEYEANYSEVMDYADIVRDKVSEGRTKIEKSLYGLGKEVKKILPFKSTIIDNFLTKYEEENQKYSTQSEEEARNLAITGTLTGIFDKQLNIQKAIQARNEATDEVEAKRSLVSTKAQLNLLTNIDANQATSTAFTTQVAKDYYRKSLELQFKMFYVQADLLKTSKDSFTAFSAQFDSIVKNTALPDYVKTTNSEFVKEQMKRDLAEGFKRNVFSNNKYVQNVKEKLGKYVNSKVSLLKDGIDSITDVMSNLTSATDNPEDFARLAGIIGANLAGSTLGTKLGEKISPKIKEAIKDNITINKTAKRLGTLGADSSTFFSIARRRNQEARDRVSENMTMGGDFVSALRTGLGDLLGITKFTDQYGGYIEDPNIASHNKPAIFDNKTHRSITEIIPMYLSKILKENTDLRFMYYNVNANKLKNTKYKDSEEQLYNYNSRSLMSSGEYIKDIETSLLKVNKEKERTSYLAKDIISSSGKGKVSKETEKDLEKFITQLKTNNFSEKDIEEILTSPDSDLAKQTALSTNKELREIVAGLGKSSSELKKNLHGRVKDIYRKYPTSNIVTLFSNVSRLAGRTAFNVVTTDQAEIIAKAISVFNFNSRKDGGSGGDMFIPEDGASGILAVSVPKKDLEKVRTVLTIFSEDCTSILNSGDTVAIATLDNYFAVVNQALARNVALDKEIFQSLRDLHPGLVPEGRLTVDNFVEGKIGNYTSEEVEFGDMGDVKEIRSKTAVKRKDNESSIVESLVSRINESQVVVAGREIKDNFKGIKEVVKEKGLRSATSEIKQAFVKSLDTIKSATEKVYNDALGSVKELKTVAEELVDTATEKSTIVIINQLNDILSKLERKIESFISGETNAKLIKITELNKGKSILEGGTNLNVSDLDKLKVEIEKNSDANIKALTSVKEEIVRLRKELFDLMESISNTDRSESKLAELVKKIDDFYNNIKKITVELDKTLNTIKGV